MNAPPPTKPISAVPSTRAQDIEFWLARLRKPCFTQAGVRKQSPNWSATFQFDGQRREWSLETPNKEAAAAKAREIYLSLVERGWEATIAEYRPEIRSKTVMVAFPQKGVEIPSSTTGVISELLVGADLLSKGYEVFRA